MHISLLSWCERFFEKLKYQGYNAQNRRSGEISNCLFETYKKFVITPGKHMFQTSSEMTMSKMCEYPSSNYVLPHWKCVLCCCAQYPWIDLPSLDSDKHSSNVIPTIRFHVYQQI